MSQSELCPTTTKQPPMSFYKLDKSERERIKTMRDVINKFTGIFGFSAQSQNLFCIVCKYELPYNGLDRIVVDVNAHVESPAHQSTLQCYVQQESANINSTIGSAISRGMFVQVMEGLVQCTVCDGQTMSDSLSNLKRHVLLDSHKFAAAGVKLEEQNYSGPVGKKMIELVIEHEQLEFTYSEDGKPKVRCIKCDQLLQRDHSDIVRHLACKKHTDVKRKPKRKPANIIQKMTNAAADAVTIKDFSIGHETNGKQNEIEPEAVLLENNQNCQQVVNSQPNSTNIKRRQRKQNFHETKKPKSLS